jgi:hypothetical protein
VSEGVVIEAVVQVGEAETRYLRRGRGARAVVVLAEDEPERLRLLERFSGAACVIAPVPFVPARHASGAHALSAAGLADWLLGVIDGLGIERPEVVLSPALAGLAPVLARRCGELVQLVEPAATGDG